MAELSYKLHIKDSDDIYECVCYDIKNDAIPTTNNNGTGDAWELKNNGIVCYIGLWPTSATNTPPRLSGDTSELSIITPLTITKDGATYNALRYVLNTFNISIAATQNQKITLTYYDATNTQQSVEVTDSAKEVVALASTLYTCVVTADEGYTKGALNVAENGYVNGAMSISANAATINSYTGYVNVAEGLTVNITNTTQNTAVQSFSTDANAQTFTANYKDVLTVSVVNSNAAQYNYTLKVGGHNGTLVDLSSGGTYTVPAGSFDIATTSTVRQYTVTLEQGTGTTLSVTANGVGVTSGTTYNYGTEFDYSATANTGYESVNATAGGV